MKLKKCASNHFYDAQANTHCPHCPALAQEAPVQGSSAALEARQPGTPAPVMPMVSAVQEAYQAPVTPIAPSPAADDQKTVAVWEAPAGTEPVVGWLVCTSGAYFGQSFTLKTGNNGVGRSLDMDIPLAQEDGVARNRHCIITFDPMSRAFYIQPGEENAPTYLNGERLLSYTKITRRDMLQLGNCKLMFRPLCDENFSWETMM